MVKIVQIYACHCIAFYFESSHLWCSIFVIKMALRFWISRKRTRWCRINGKFYSKIIEWIKKHLTQLQIMKLKWLIKIYYWELLYNWHLPNVKFGYSKQAPHKKAHYNFLKVTSAANLGLFCHKVVLDVRQVNFIWRKYISFSKYLKFCFCEIQISISVTSL